MGEIVEVVIADTNVCFSNLGSAQGCLQISVLLVHFHASPAHLPQFVSLGDVEVPGLTQLYLH